MTEPTLPIISPSAKPTIPLIVLGLLLLGAGYVWGTHAMPKTGPSGSYPIESVGDKADPANRILFLKKGSDQKKTPYSVNIDGTGVKPVLADTKDFTYDDLVVSPRYTYATAKAWDPRNTKDAFFYLFTTDGKDVRRIAYKTPESDARNFAFSRGLISWIISYEVSGEHNEEVQYRSLADPEKLDSVRQIFTSINGFKISPKSDYIAVDGFWDENHEILVLEDIVRHEQLLRIQDPYQYFFDNDNFYYGTNMGYGLQWNVYHLREGVTDTLSVKPAYWDNKFEGDLNPYTQDRMIILKPGWSFKVADADGLHAREILLLEDVEGYIEDFRWAPGGKSAIYTIEHNGQNTMWVLNIDSGEHHKILSF